MSSPSQVIVVVEDGRHKMLVYRYLSHHRLEKMTRIVLSPSGRGSGEHWVRRKFVQEVSAYRKRHAKTALIAVIDADTHSVQDRLRQLDRALAESGKPAVDTSDEQIARLVPKRNVETWILCLNGHLVDEEIDYKWTRDDWSDVIPPAARVLFDWTRPNAELPNRCVDSLRRGVEELNRLEF
jgi:hypothetical protein